MANLEPLVRGDTEKITLTIKNEDKVTARNITNDAIRFTIKRSLYDAVALVTKTVGSGITKTNTLGGLAEVTIAPTDLLALSRDQDLWCDVEITDNAGRVSSRRFTLPFVVDIST